MSAPSPAGDASAASKATTSKPAANQVLTSMAYIKKRPDMTLDEFYTYWKNVHGPLVKPWAEKHNFISYRQICLKPELNKGHKPLGPEATGPGLMDLSEWDGLGMMEITDFGSFAAAFEDPYYKNIIFQDEFNFVDKKLGALRSRGEVNEVMLDADKKGKPNV